MEQKIVTKDSRVQNNYPNIDSYLKDGWFIKHVIYIQDQFEIKYVLEKGNDNEISLLEGNLEILKSDKDYYKDVNSLLEDQVHNYKVRIHQLENRLCKLLNFWPVKLFYLYPLSWVFEDKFNKAK